MAGVSLQNLTRRSIPLRPVLLRSVAAAVLPGWDISLVFVGEEKARDLNMHLRKKSYVPNVLSYEAGRTSGEIIICPSIARRESTGYDLAPDRYLFLLFIHALLHLKGWVHGATMEKRERELLATYLPAPRRTRRRNARKAASHSPDETKNRNRNRHRHVPSKNGRGGRGR